MAGACRSTFVTLSNEPKRKSKLRHHRSSALRESDPIRSGTTFSQLRFTHRSQWLGSVISLCTATLNGSGASVVTSSRNKDLPSAWLPPQLATLTEGAPDGEEWLHEIKFDGYRILAWIDRARTRLFTRNRKDWTDRFPEVAAALAALGLQDTVWDGEVAVELEGGATSFQALQNALSAPGRGALRFFVFDVLRHSGRDVRRLPLIDRKALLQESVAGAPPELIRYSDHMIGIGPAFHEQACAHGLEGII